MSITTNEIVKKLSEKVPAEYISIKDVPGRPKLSYISIDKMVLMLNDRVGDNWNITNIKVEPTKNGDGFYCTLDLVITNGDLTIVRAGVGADIHRPSKTNPSAIPDYDKLIKTAYAQALKSAANRYGLGLELWDDTNIHDDAPAVPNVNQAPIPAPNTDKPSQLNQKSKDLVGKFCEETKLTKAELSEFLKEIHPESAGNPVYLASSTEATEEANVKLFLDKVKEQLKK
jgi:hypothetical protein